MDFFEDFEFFFESAIFYDKFQLIAKNRVNKPMIEHLKALEGWMKCFVFSLVGIGGSRNLVEGL